MPRIIFTSRYLKPKSVSHKANLVNYVATRIGVEKLPTTQCLLEVTQKQSLLVSQLLKSFPDSKNAHEYADYLANPNRVNASEFITQTLESNLDIIDKRQNYVDYIANRPRVEIVGSHGLFSDSGIPIVLPQVAREVSEHSGNVWMNVISLRREDAERLGYDNVQAWQSLIRGKRNIIAESMKIKPENLRWFASFHNENHHPHCHMLAYSIDPTEAYVTNSGIENMRSAFAREIFKHDLVQIYEHQTESRNELGTQSQLAMQTLIAQMLSGVCENENIEKDILLLADRLSKTGGKKAYGYLKADVKAIVNRIVDELSNDERVEKCYEEWCKWRGEVLATYSDQPFIAAPLSQQPEFKKIKNMVIDEARNLGSHRFDFEPDSDEPVELQDDFVDGEPLELADDEALDLPDYYNADWSDGYKLARIYLYGSDDVEQNIAEAFRLFMEEALTGNALAMHDVGRMYSDGLGVEADTEIAHKWYAKSLYAFLELESSKSKPYFQYRIGKLYAAGLGVTQDYVEAATWFSKAASKNYNFAQYSLAGLYYSGKGVEQDFIKAFALYQKSASKGNAYASYELAKMYRDGIATEKDIENANVHFKAAFLGFQNLEQSVKDDKLQYRLGKMLQTGIGTEKNITAAIEYFERASELRNIYAQYSLAKIYLEDGGEHENISEALKWMTISADNGNPFAQYAVAKLFLTGQHLDKDISKAIALFEKSAEQGNQFAQFQLGKLYLTGQDIPRDKEKATFWLSESASQGNIYAQLLLEHIDNFREPSIVLAATRLLRQLGKIFEDNQKATMRVGSPIDRKLRRDLQKKKEAQGHAHDDQTPIQSY